MGFVEQFRKSQLTTKSAIFKYYRNDFQEFVNQLITRPRGYGDGHGCYVGIWGSCYCAGVSAARAAQAGALPYVIYINTYTYIFIYIYIYI